MVYQLTSTCPSPHILPPDLSSQLFPLSCQMPDLKSEEPVTESPSHQHACLLILDALLAVMRNVQTGARREAEEGAARAHVCRCGMHDMFGQLWLWLTACTAVP